MLKNLPEQMKLAPLKRRKRRVVPKEKRQRALFSCDRCKQRKIKCNRVNITNAGALSVQYDSTTRCLNCEKSGAECITSMERKKRRYYKSTDNLELRYQVLMTLVSGLYPEVDTEDITRLIELGKSKGVDMPDLDDYSANSGEMVYENSTLEQIGSKSPILQQVPETCLTGSAMIATRQTKPVTPMLVLPNSDVGLERMVYDTQGKPHYIGYASTAALFNSLCNLLLSNSLKARVNFYKTVYTFADAEVQKFRKEKLVLLDQGACPGTTELPAIKSELMPQKFPSINFISREEADFYVEVFFNKIHYYYFIFDEDIFRERYKQYWLEIEAITTFRNNKDVSEETAFKKMFEIKKLPKNWTFCIYMVWILGAHFKPYPDGQLNESRAEKLVDVIKLALPDIVLKPSILSIRTLYLLAVHMYSSKNKDSAWVLIGLAGRQSISLGLHRKSGVTDLSFKRHISVRKQLWWSLYIFEVSTGCSFGRPSIIDDKDINIGYPKDLYARPGETDSLKYYLENIKLARILHRILKLKRLIYDADNETPLSPNIIAKTLEIRDQMIEFKKNLNLEGFTLEAALEDLKLNYNSQKLKSTFEIKRYKLDLIMNYYSDMVSLSLPFVLYIVNLVISRPEFLKHIDESIVAILNNGIESSIELSRLIYVYYELEILEGNLFFDMYYGYMVNMVLILVFVLLRSVGTIDPEGTNAHAQLLLSKLKFKGNAVTINLTLATIQRTRVAMQSDKVKLGTTIRRSNDVTEGLLHDIGIVPILDKLFGPLEHGKGPQAKESSVDSQKRRSENESITRNAKNIDIDQQTLFNRARITASSQKNHHEIVEASFKSSKLKELFGLTKGLENVNNSSLNVLSAQKESTGNQSTYQGHTSQVVTKGFEHASATSDIDISSFFPTVPNVMNIESDPAFNYDFDFNGHEMSINSAAVDAMLQTSQNASFIPFALVKNGYMDEMEIGEGTQFNTGLSQLTSWGDSTGYFNDATLQSFLG